MDFKNYDTLSESIRTQIATVTGIWQSTLGDDLVGIYLHGSLALECFMENRSDLDILILTKNPLSKAQKLSLAEAFIAVDRKPCPLEMSTIAYGDIHPWHYPTICQFHYSDFWTQRFKDRLSSKTDECYILDNTFEDTDIACHARLTQSCGITIFGMSAAQAFEDVPECDFWDSLSRDIDDYDFSAYDPRYFTSNILILGRVLSYKVLGRIISKYDAALWCADYVPKEFRHIIIGALNSWYGGETFDNQNMAELEALRVYLINEIKGV